VRYRQHGLNIVGKNRGLAARWSRLKRLLAGDLKRYIEINLKALNQMASSLTPESRYRLQILAELHRSANPIKRLHLFLAGGFHRQFWTEQLALGAAALAGRV
jgi:hypothetical protein